MTDKNILKKLQEMRIELQGMDIKKSGHNSYSNFYYYELHDILPPICSMCLDNDVATKFYISMSGETEMAYLEVINIDNPDDYIVFSCPTAEAEIGIKKDGTGGAQPIQNQGGKITYMRRYMLMMAFEIVEQDSVDSLDNNSTKPKSKKTTKTTKKESATSTAENAGFPEQSVSLKQALAHFHYILRSQGHKDTDKPQIKLALALGYKSLGDLKTEDVDKIRVLVNKNGYESVYNSIKEKGFNITS